MVEDFLNFRRPQFYVRDAGSRRVTLRMPFKAHVVYDLPFGQGRRFGSAANALLDRIIAGWRSVSRRASKAASSSISATCGSYGMTREGSAGHRSSCVSTTQNKFVYMLPQDVIDETIKAYNVSATTASGFEPRRAERALLHAGQRP